MAAGKVTTLSPSDNVVTLEIGGKRSVTDSQHVGETDLILEKIKS